MEFNEYQKLAARTAIFNKNDREYILSYLSMGLAGETGEAIDKLKKLLHYDNGVLTGEKRDLLLWELGDILWYLSQIAHNVDSSLEEVAKMNITKLEDRASRGVVTKGSGDTR